MAVRAQFEPLQGTRRDLVGRRNIVDAPRGAEQVAADLRMRIGVPGHLRMQERRDSLYRQPGRGFAADTRLEPWLCCRPVISE